MRKKILLPLLFLFPLSLQAHPVSFQDSMGIMGHHSPFIFHNQLNYSFKHWFAMGAHHFTRPNQENQSATMMTTNWLLKRWNGSALQANIYALAGGGFSELNAKPGWKALGGAQFDIEDRKYYFLAKHMQILDSATTELRQTTVRAGLAPYVGGFEDLHSWIIIDFTQTQFGDGFAMDDTTPMLRFFYQNLLFEIGQSFRGLTKFNYIVHF